MASAIFSLFAKKAASVIFGLVKDKAFGDASLKVKDLINMQAALEATITILVRESEIYQASQHIKAWTEQLRDKLDDAQRGNLTSLSTFISEISNSTSGIHFALKNLYDGLIGDTGVGQATPLFTLWHEAEYQKLANTNDITYTISSYVQSMDDKLKAVFQLIYNGLVLKVMTTTDIDHADNLSADWEKNMNGLMQTVYNNYPQAIKFLKPTYDTPWRTDAWYRLQHRGKSQWLYHDSKGSVFLGKQSGGSTEWQFSPSIDQGLVGLIGQDGNRLKINTYSSSGIAGHTENTKRGSDVVFKMVPLLNVPDPVVQMVGPYSMGDTTYKYDCRSNKNIGVYVPFNDWVLEI